jgi:hemoglobin
MRYIFISLILILNLQSCANSSSTLYQQLGGEKVIAEIVENFIHEIEYNEYMFSHFKDSDIERFREKLNEHICFLAAGPCEYTGDTMQQVHAGMNITEDKFNLSVDLFINAMNKAKVPHTIQNKLLAAMVPARREIIYQ